MPSLVMAKGEAEVKRVMETIIQAEVPPPVSSLELPPNDAKWHRFHYACCVLFYRTDPDRFPSILALLRTGLRQVLGPFYPLTGRLACRSNGRFVIDFTRESGVEFVEASTDVSYTDVLNGADSDGGGNNFQLRPFFKKLCKRGRHEQSQIFDIPLLSVQVTEFAGGGFALGCAQSHVVGDAPSFWQFMKSWSECAGGLAISSPPLHQRDRFIIRNPSPELAWTPFDSLVLNKEDLQEEAGTWKEENVPLSQRCFLFTAQMIQRLKALASQEGGGSGPFTTYELLCAHFWKHVSKARAREPSTHVHLVVLANCRSRMSPPLPPSYFGNCVGTAAIQTTIGEILTESLVATALRIRSGVKQSIDETLWHRLSHWLELHNYISKSVVAPKGVGMVVTSSPRLPCYEVDFGDTTGSPESVRTTHVNGDGEMVLFPSGHNTSSIDICMALKPQVMDRLLGDPFFLNI